MRMAWGSPHAQDAIRKYQAAIHKLTGPHVMHPAHSACTARMFHALHALHAHAHTCTHRERKREICRRMGTACAAAARSVAETQLQRAALVAESRSRELLSNVI